MTICLSCARYLINLHTAIRFFFSLCVRRRWLAIYPPNDKLPTSTWAQKLVDFCHHSASLSPAFLWKRGSFTPDYCAKLLLFSICVAQNHCSKQKEPGFAHFLLMSKHNQELWFMDMQLEKLLFPGRTQYFPFLSITGVYMMPHPNCVFLWQVQGALKRQWTQYKTQWGQRRREHCSTRSTSYTATSITEVPVYLYHHDPNNEHLNGRYIEDSELVALKSGETSA